MELDLSAPVAPQSRTQSRSQNRSRNGSQHTVFSTQSSKGSSRSQLSRTEQITPPLTPSTSTEDLAPAPVIPQAQFQNYLRAIYPYHPPCDDASSSVTLPLNQGDLVLIHSVHVNGWADGTLLASCKRGWLPTNYCEAYNPTPVARLMGALTTFYDIMLCCDEDGSLMALCNQDYMRGLVAGIRFLFEITGCLNRDSPMLAVEGGISNLRRHRKAVLSELSALVKLAKNVDASFKAQDTTILEADILERMLATAFRMALRAAKFHEVWANETAAAEQRRLVLSNLNITAASSLASAPPPTPPAEVSHFKEVGLTSPTDSDINTPMTMSFESDITSASSSALASPRDGVSRLLEQPSEPCMQQTAVANKRPQSLTVSQPLTHRVSWTKGQNAQRNGKLASERLLKTHETFLSHLQVFISSQFRYRSRNDILLLTHRILHAGRALMTVVDAVWDRGQRSLENLNEVRDKMYGRIADLVSAARHIFQPSEHADDSDYLPEDMCRIEDAATACVRGSGKCVETTRRALVFIGDFEFETLEIPLDSPSKDPTECDDSVETVEDETPSALEADNQADDATEIAEPIEEAKDAEAVESVENVEAESPETPIAQEPEPVDDTTPVAKPPVSPTRLNRELPPPPPRIDTGVSSSEVVTGHNEFTPASASSIISSSLLPAISSISTPSTWQTDHSPMSLITPASKVESEKVQSAEVEEESSKSADEKSASEDGKSATVHSSGESTHSDAPTTVTSIDSEPATFEPDTIRSVDQTEEKASSDESFVEAETEDVEATMLQSTHAHELVLKDGVVVGGTLPALVERLTAHDTTPNALFINTFYLTFRLFTTPIELSQALVNRYEGIDMNLKSAAPIKLRVYNVFKQWLETHWRPESDEPALEVIKAFSKEKLSPLLPSCAQRLNLLVEKLQDPSGSPAASVTAVPHVASDKAAPSPVLSKSQNNILKLRNNGGAAPCITDFDPLEIARQLTLKGAAIFCRIAPEELVDCEWTKKSASIAVNVRAMIQLSTDLTNLVVDTILQHEEPSKRAKTIKHWLKIGAKCLELNNFDSLTAIISSINNSTVRRLKKTWEAASAKTMVLYKELTGAVDFSKNFKGLRSRLADVVPPCLPFVGMYLTDLTFNDIGNQSTRTGADGTTEVINFDRYTKTTKFIFELQRFQVGYTLQEVPELQSWIQEELVRVRSDASADCNLYKRSCMLEPRETTKPGAPSGIPVPVADAAQTRTARERVDFLGSFFTKSSAH